MNIKINTPPYQHSHAIDGTSISKPRSSNLELYRIICMLMIVAHHYVVNSGLLSEGGPIATNIMSTNTIYLLLFGAWGKVGINCFLMITGYFMCTSKITIKKFLKLVLQIYFYKLLIYAIFLLSGYETFSIVRTIRLVMPFWGISSGFVGCFLIFYLTIPFWNIFIKNISQQQHKLLLVLLLMCYTILGSVPTFSITFNYVTWFGIIYLIASYIRLYPNPIFEKKIFWGWITFTTFLLCIVTIILVRHLNVALGLRLSCYHLMADSNKVFPAAFAVSSFLYFKNMGIKYSKIINAFGAATFGVLLIHANSNAMRTWLWQDVVDCVGHYSLSLSSLILYSMGIVLAVFLVCNLIDQLRIATLEKWFFNWYDRKIAAKADNFVTKKF